MADDSVECDREIIVDAPGEIHKSVDQAEGAIMALPGDPRIYQRGGILVRIVRRGPNSARTIRIERAADALAILPADGPHLLDLMAESAVWMRPKRGKKSGEEYLQPVNPPPLAAAALLSRGKWRFPPLTALVMGPTLRPDYSVLDRPGYDPRTGFYFHDGGVPFEPIPENPDRKTALAALRAVKEILEEFPFASDVDESVALAMLLTAPIRQSLNGAPLFGNSATIMGSGKTLLGQCAALLATGLPAAIVTPPKDAGDEKKTFFALFLEGGDPVVLIDNYSTDIQSDFLCAVLTAEEIKDRVLGFSKSATASTSALLVCTGNNLKAAGELTSRTLICHLDPKTEHPEHRHCSRNLMQWLPAQRARLVPAALTFLRGFIASGERPEVEPWQRFPDWDALIRYAIVWADLPDPLLALRQGEASDPKRIEHMAVMESWYDQYQSEPKTVREAIKDADTAALGLNHALKDALLDVAGERGEVNMRRLGRWMGKMRGRLQNGYRIEAGNLKSGTQTWRVMK